MQAGAGMPAEPGETESEVRTFGIPEDSDDTEYNPNY